MRHSRRVRGDDGASLVLALVFMVVVGLFVTVALEKNQAVSLSGQRVGERVQLQYTLDGAVDRTLQRLRSEVASGNPTSCTSPTAPNGQGTFALNGLTAKYTCTTLAGRTTNTGDNTVTNYALVTTSPNTGALTSQSGVSQDLQVAGSIFLNRVVANADVGKPIKITDGDLVTPQAANCQSQLDAVTNIELIGSGQLRSCTTQTLGQALPAVTLPTPAPTVDLSTSTFAATSTVNIGDGLALTSGSRSCTVFFPGRYTKPPALTNNSKNYFVSGLYYFDFPNSAPTWTIDDANVEVVAGARSLSTDTAVPDNDCKSMGVTDAMALAAPLALLQSATFGPYVFSHGATWVFGGRSKLEVKKGSVSMFSPPTNGSSVPVNLVGASSYTASDYTSQPVDTATLTGGGNNSSIEINAKVFAPNSYLEIFSTNNTIAAARGGVVGYRVHLKASAAGSDALVISAGSQGNPPPPFRTVLVETTDDSGTSSARNRTVATIGNFAPFTVTVRSWRTD